MIKLLEEYESNGYYDFNYLLDRYEFPDYSKYKNDSTILYHNTHIENVNDISKNGLSVSKSRQLEYSGNMIWCVNFSGATGYGGCTVAFKNTFNENDYEQVNKDDVVIYKDVQERNILFIDTWICEDVSLKRLSDIKRLVSRLGEDRVRKTLYKKYDNGVPFFYDIDYLIEKSK